MEFLIRGALLGATVAVLAGCGGRSGAAGEPGQKGQATRLATLPDEEPEPEARGSLHVSIEADRSPVFGELGGVAYVEEAGPGSRVVHRGREGRTYQAIGELVVSRDGLRSAYGALTGGAWHVVVDGVEGPAFSAVKGLAFCPDGVHVAYQGMAGDRWHLVVDGRLGRGTPTRILGFGFACRASRIAWIDDADDFDRFGRLAVADLSLEGERTIALRAGELTVGEDRSTVAAVVRRGGHWSVIVAPDGAAGAVREGAGYDRLDGLTLSRGGQASYFAERDGRRFVVNGGREEVAGIEELPAVAVARPSGGGVGALVATDGGKRLREFGTAAPAGGVRFEEAEGLAYSEDGRLHAYAARRGDRWFVVVNGHEGPSFDRVVTPIVSPDAKRVVYRAREDAERFVVVADARGRTLRRLPSYEQVFPVRLAAGGRSIVYGTRTGRDVFWREDAL
jgi:hypothetical protein